MKRYRLMGSGAQTLGLADETVPVPGPGEALVRMRAAAINYRDLGIIGGAYPNKPGVVPLSDGAGIVEAVGAGVTSVRPGDAVASCFYPYWESGPATSANHRASLGCEIDGVLAELAIVPASGLVAKPAGLDFTEAATLPCAGLTAWTALFTEGRLLPGQTVVIQGTGGVALFALQFTTMIGARTILLSGSDAKLERARSMGADVTINYRTTPDWAAAVLDATGGEGADLIVELGGGATLANSLNCIRTGGRISIIGVLGGLVAEVPIPPILFRHIHMTGITVGHREDFQTMCAAIDANGITPVIDRTFAFADAAGAYTHLPKGEHFGKLVIEIG